MPRPGPERAKLQFREDPDMIAWVEKTALAEYPQRDGTGNEAQLLRALIREARIHRERRAQRQRRAERPR